MAAVVFYEPLLGGLKGSVGSLASSDEGGKKCKYQDADGYNVGAVGGDVVSAQPVGDPSERAPGRSRVRGGRPSEEMVVVVRVSCLDPSCQRLQGLAGCVDDRSQCCCVGGGGMGGTSTSTSTSRARV